MKSRVIRLTCSSSARDVRLWGIRRRWVASTDTLYGATLGLGLTPFDAIARALDPIDDAEELLESVPDELFWTAY
jgi:hypothetical protein